MQKEARPAYRGATQYWQMEAAVLFGAKSSRLAEGKKAWRRPVGPASGESVVLWWPSESSCYQGSDNRRQSTLVTTAQLQVREIGLDLFHAVARGLIQTAQLI